MDIVNTENTIDQLSYINANLKKQLMDVSDIRTSQDQLSEHLNIFEANSENNKAAIAIIKDEQTK